MSVALSAVGMSYTFFIRRITACGLIRPTRARAGLKYIFQEQRFNNFGHCVTKSQMLLKIKMHSIYVA